MLKVKAVSFQVKFFWVLIICNVAVGYQCFKAWTSEMLVSCHNTTNHHNPEEPDLNLHQHENLISHCLICFLHRCELILRTASCLVTVIVLLSQHTQNPTILLSYMQHHMHSTSHGLPPKMFLL